MNSFLKKWSVDIVLLFLRCALGVKQLIILCFAHTGRLFYLILKLLFRRPLFSLYRAHLKIQSRYELLGTPIKNSFFYITSSKALIYISVACIALLVVRNNLSLRDAPPDILNPHNILSRVVSQADDIIVEEGTIEGFDAIAYAPLSGVKSTLVAQADEVETEEDLQRPQSSAIAFSPGALIKPTIPTTTQNQEVSEPAAMRTYIVQPGDTIGRIASRFGLKIQTVLDANGLSFTSTLSVGRRLTILPRDGVMYRVRRGDTLASIAHTYQSSIDKIVASNPSISSERISAGQVVFIPDGVSPNIAAPRQDRTLIGQLKTLLSPKKVQQALKPTIARVGALLWPTTARRITQYFSWHHPGVDIAGPPSNKILAVADGVVSYSGWLNGYGYSVLINHSDGKKTRYAHASKLLVKKGTRVKKGQAIAMVGSTGRSTGPHLHFELYVGGKRVNPFAYIR